MSGTPVTRLDKSTWTWSAAGQQPLVIGAPGHQRTIDPRKLTVVAYERGGGVTVVIEGPVVKHGKAAGNWVADILDSASDRCPAWVRWLVESVTGERVAS